MSKYNKTNIGTKEVNKKLVEYIEHIDSCITRSILAINQKNPPEKEWGIVLPLLHAIGESCHSIRILINSALDPKQLLIPKARDTTIIARSVIETALNIIFILAKGENAAERAHMHYVQKSYRNLAREIKVLDQVLKIKWRGKIDLNKNKKLKKSIEEFTKKKNKEVYEWTPESNLKKIEYIHKKYGATISKGIQLAYFVIYAPASEIIHGTYFGSMFLLGFSEPRGHPNTPEEFDNYQRGWVTAVVTMIFLSVNSLVKTIAKELEFEELEKIWKDVAEAYKNEFWFKDMWKSENNIKIYFS